MAHDGFLTSPPAGAVEGCDCCPGCEIGADTFDGPSISSDWLQISGDWEEDGVRTGTGAGIILYLQRPDNADDAVKIRVKATPTVGDPNTFRVILDVQDPQLLDSSGNPILDSSGNPTYGGLGDCLFVEVRLDTTGCAEIQIGRGEDYLADPVPLFYEHDELEETLYLEICYVPNHTLTVKIAGQFVVIGTSPSVWDGSPRGEIWSVADIVQSSALLDHNGNPILDSSGNEIEETAAPEASFNRLVGFEVIEGTVEFDDWFYFYLQDSATESPYKLCPRCNPSCFVFQDGFYRPADQRSSLGCHWTVLSGAASFQEFPASSGSYYPEFTTAGHAVSKHPVRDLLSRQYVRVEFHGEYHPDSGYYLEKNKKVGVIFGYNPNNGDYYKVETWWTETSPGVGRRWRMELFYKTTSLLVVTAPADIGFNYKPFLLLVCYDGSVVTASTLGFATGDTVANTPFVGLRYALGPITGKYSGISGEPAIYFDGFSVSQPPISDYEEHLIRYPTQYFGCFDCIDWASPCGNCDQETPKILMGTLQGVTGTMTGFFSSEDGPLVATGSDLDGSYLVYSSPALGTCCVWKDPSTDFIFADRFFHQLQPWEQELVPLHWKNNYGSGPYTRYYTRVYGRLRSVLLQETKIWATYVVETVGWIENSMGGTDVYGNPIPDDWQEMAGSFGLLRIQNVAFQTDLPEDFDCDANFDLTLNADSTGHGDACGGLGLQEGIGGLGFIHNDPLDFTASTLRIRRVD